MPVQDQAMSSMHLNHRHALPPAWELQIVESLTSLQLGNIQRVLPYHSKHHGKMFGFNVLCLLLPNQFPFEHQQTGKEGDYSCTYHIPIPKFTCQFHGKVHAFRQEQKRSGPLNDISEAKGDCPVQPLHDKLVLLKFQKLSRVQMLVPSKDRKYCLWP
ncbi:hypothetical protein PHYBLDRAFT_58536 [Phycomyces blakesleeanus NRRL 1555(-)]|uniref:Uncharacterized protein n=1 Tax=Phycomyces blakesleeanus (strain ATCC 8743b / DSM 1359 / FGSC 10004 / NBRC 33097 / NRRL 1555) TaxID=763407 RepID=A0A167QCP2_PHYB8|nr:hypothetical protein PHYBLDRAFT_58536 [Phycomyces blakesleeanus NRRL 1555(-)]OAD79488.1 hypothetical protein PHYBLDRAFT_58536 [Phycomyces blakesleeanus NRRL 1555(-)]|eukprot:XP_018297528.1 hypothetical protein PHYBLDRAFT_58536 [Phycomyces blakesleeanus NRRL 1555(-)]